MIINPIKILNMKAKQLNNGRWTISDISSEKIVALAKILSFAHNAECACGNHPEEERMAVLALREDGNTLGLVSEWNFFIRCLKDYIERK
jgi:hypothetical protein